ncbi:MAG: hypothetical protein R3C12_12400 [Planctomycetaceae bacterium]
MLAGQADELDRLGQQSRNARERVESLQGEKEELTAQIKQLREELQAATAMVESTKEAASDGPQRTRQRLGTTLRGTGSRVPFAPGT